MKSASYNVTFDVDMDWIKMTETKTVELSREDARVITAILYTHAEMQDQSAIVSGELYARLMRDEPHNEDAVEMRDVLKGQIDDLETDATNLKRIGQIFEEG